MAVSFSDIHEAILAEAKDGVPFPYSAQNNELKGFVFENDFKFKPEKTELPKQKTIKIKRDISTEKVKDLILSRKKCGCSICGYNKCTAVLEFHHINPSEKSFTISKAYSSYSLDEILKELKKCILVCANCHKEIHAGIIKI